MTDALFKNAGDEENRQGGICLPEGQDRLPPGIAHDAERRLWALTTQQSTYAFGVTAENLVVHLYWGPRLLAWSDLPAPALPLDHSSQDPALYLATEEYAPWGGLRFGETALKVTFADATRDLDLRFERATLSEQNALPTLLLDLHDAVYALRVTLCYQVDVAHDLVIRSVIVANHSTSTMTLERVFSAHWHLPRQNMPRTLTTLAGQWASEARLQRQQVVAGTSMLESRRGITGASAYPCFALDTAATEFSGEVYFGSLAWSGNWTLRVTTSITGATTILGGIHDHDFAWQLAPGATFHTPAFVAGFADDGMNGMRRRLHSYTRDSVLPSEHAHVPRPILYNSWEATGFDVTEAGQKALAERAARLGVELFVVDDGWFLGRNDDRAGLGNWYPDPQKFPRGLGPLIDDVQQRGMLFGLWVEPEMVNPDSDVYRLHPEWVYHFPSRPRSEARHQLVLNVGREDVQLWLLNSLNRLLDDYAISFIKWDMNRAISEPGWPEQPERGRELWVRHVQGVYAILQELRRRHPHLLIESCASGGGRADLGILHYTDQVWASDNTHPDARLQIQEGFSLVLPACVMSSWVTDAPDEQLRHQLPLAYRFHVSMLGVLGIGANLLNWTEEELAEGSYWMKQYKALRPLIQRGHQYWLASSREGGLTAVAYVDSDQKEAVVFAFRQSDAFGIPPAPLRLQGLTHDAYYRVESEHLSARCYSGAYLIQRGLDMPLRKGAYASCVVRVMLETATYQAGS